MAQQALILTLAYGLGSLPFGVWISRALGTADLRRHGSGGSGATNVLRRHGWAAALLVAGLDGAKGWLAAAWLPRMVEGAGLDLSAAAGLAAVAGHVWPVFARFRGGKGVATSAGVVLAIAPPALAGAALIFALVVALTRKVSPGSVAAAAALPLLLYATGPADPPWLGVGLGSMLFVLVLFTHRKNLGKLRRGEEPNIGR